MVVDRAAEMIRRAEREIRGQIAEAAASGAYGLVDRLSSLARRLADLADEAAGTPEPASAAASPASKGGKPRSGAKRVAASGRKPSRMEGYPRFERSRDTLLKIGWSKKSRTEYVHRAQRAGLDAVVLAVTDLGRNGRVFTTEELLPAVQQTGDSDLPEYQAYVCLAWLRAIGVVEQHGREGYSVPDGDPAVAVGRAWEALPKSRG
ncbi:MAG: hypothetical protein KF817_03640 [Phycisphaeraceae bacterium]|nr:hypothetical protein [Phycisphaeraceae bacterium]